MSEIYYPIMDNKF